MQKTNVWKMAVFGALVLALPGAAGVGVSSDVEVPEEAVPAGGTGGSWLLVLDVNPWGRTANQDAFNSNGISFDQINSADLATTTLSAYDGLLIPSVQNAQFYENLDANAAAISGYVAGGGLLVAHATQQSTTGGADEFLPGCTSYTQEFNDAATIVDAQSPIVDGVPESALQGWFSTAHGSIGDLPLVSSTIIENGAGNPIHATYPWGLGNVFVTGMTIEWVYWQGQPRSLVLDNEVTLDVLPDPVGGFTNLLTSPC